MKHDAAMHNARRVVGEWEIDPSLNELRRGGESLRIEPKAMELLVLLAERTGQVIGRAELLEAIWPGVVVGDETLSQAITKLRKALHDNAREPAYIETIPKRGYRLLAPVRLEICPGASIDGTASVQPGPPMPEPRSPPDAVTLPRPGQPPGRGARGALLAAGIAVAAVAAATVSITALMNDRPGTSDAPSAVSGSSVPGVVAASVDAPIAPAIPMEVPAEPPTITIVPFETLTGTQEHDYLARGIAADLATDLSRLTGLNVVALPRPLDPKTLPTGVAQYLVSGTLQVDRDRLRINVSLSDAVSQRKLWSDRYDAPAGDPLSVQKGVVSRLLGLLPTKVSEAAREQVARRYTRNPAAYDSFLRGQAVVAARRPEDNREARAMYRKALAFDPTFARAYGMLALTYALDYRYGFASDVPDPLARAMELAEIAHGLNDDTPETWWVLGFTQAQARRHDEALRSLQRALELNRSYAEAWIYIGTIHVFTGRAEQALPYFHSGLRMHPEGRSYYYNSLACAYLLLGDNELALVNAREAVQRNPTFLESRLFLTATLVAMGDLDGARWEADEIRMLFPDFDPRAWFETFPMTDDAYRRRLADLLRDAGL